MSSTAALGKEGLESLSTCRKNGVAYIRVKQPLNPAAASKVVLMLHWSFSFAKL